MSDVMPLRVGSVGRHCSFSREPDRSAATMDDPSTDLNVRVTVRYPVPANATVADVLALFRSAVWVNDMIRYIVPYLKTKTKKEVLDALQANKAPYAGLDECVICMRCMVEAVTLPCTHIFHSECICEWLKVRNTCPTCRFSFQNQFSGRYTFRKIATTLVVSDTSDEAALNALDLSGQEVTAVVHANLSPVLPGATEEDKYFPCELNATVATAEEIGNKDDE
ncbi:hypothetical protein AeRB84_000706 [Aphanomyces euteiches]|nr:hypothetical protein AeRB84_000706 [Aphanomyces euteiches]